MVTLTSRFVNDSITAVTTTRTVKRFTVRLSATARRRERFRKEKGKIVEFMVQLEVKVVGQWREVLRYDCAHGYAHCDRYNLRGRQKKERLSGTYEEVLTKAEDDINANWQRYQKRFLEGGYP